MAIAGLYKCFEHWHKQGTVWIYSDTHFDDEELATGVRNRPSAEEQVKLINSKVGRKDTLILLGDVGNIEWAKKLRGYKILIAGNHDAGLSNYEGIFDEVYGGPLMIGEKLILSHEPINVPWAINLHGHCHQGSFNPDIYHYNFCSDVINYTPINFNQWMKQGHLSKIESLHRTIINKATKKKKSSKLNTHGQKR